MEGYALGYIGSDTAKTEKTEQGETKETPKLKAVKEMMDKGLFSTDGNSDLLWGLLILLLAFGGKSRDELSEYWRGRYDALKEMIECGGKDTK